jgi:hypothetical protein
MFVLTDEGWLHRERRVSGGGVLAHTRFLEPDVHHVRGVACRAWAIRY